MDADILQYLGVNQNDYVYFIRYCFTCCFFAARFFVQFSSSGVVEGNGLDWALRVQAQGNDPVS